MARLLLFEDNPDAIMLAQFAIEDSKHELVGTAESLTKAQNYLAQLITKEFEADILLLDGNLDKHDIPKPFSFTLPRDEGTVKSKRIFGRDRDVDSYEVTIEPEPNYSFGSDARMIKQIIEAAGLQIPIIGISSNEMTDSGVTVDFDLKKEGLYKHDAADTLNEVIDLLLHNRQ